MKNIAVITGASSGIGKRFVDTLFENGTYDEVWVIARRMDRLSEIKLPCPVRAIALDLSKRESYKEYEALLNEADVNIKLLINCSGFGKFSATMDENIDTLLNMVDLNCQGLMAMCHISVPHMGKGSSIINIASVAAFQPIPYINVYGASKAFVLSFSRALNRELKKDGISVMAVCPFWTKTEFFDRAIKPDEDAVVKKYIAMYEPRQIVGRAIADYKKGKSVSLFGFKTKMQLLAVKLVPVSMVMKVWKNQQKLKNRD